MTNEDILKFRDYLVNNNYNKILKEFDNIFILGAPVKEKEVSTEGKDYYVYATSSYDYEVNLSNECVAYCELKDVTYEAEEYMDDYEEKEVIVYKLVPVARVEKESTYKVTKI